MAFDTVAFGLRLKDARAAAGLTLEEVARRADCALQSVWRYEQGRSTPSIEQVEKLAAAVGVAPAALLGFEATGTEG